MSKKNELESNLIGKNKLFFIIISEDKSIYGMFFPNYIIGKENFSTNVSFFTLTKGIEIKEEKYESLNFFTNIKFSNNYLIKVGEKSWLFKLYYDHIIFNSKQNLIQNYNKEIMKNSKIKKIMVFKCK